jgi:hypothetical protein
LTLLFALSIMIVISPKNRVPPLNVNISAITVINVLKSPTNPDWIEQALSNLDVILLDCSHC